MSNKKNIVGAQVSSLRPYLQTPQELRASLQKLADMGYRTVQMQWWNPEFEPELVAAAVRDAGLTCVSTQDLYTAVRDDFERTVRLNVLCGSTCVCVSGIPAPVPDTASVLAFSAELAAMGMTLAFHPRAREWAPADTAEPGLSCTELLLEHTPQNVTLGLDLYHSGKAGLAPDALLRRWAGRVEFVHFKDYCVAPDVGARGTGRDGLERRRGRLPGNRRALGLCRAGALGKGRFPVYAGEPGRHARLGL